MNVRRLLTLLPLLAISAALLVGPAAALGQTEEAATGAEAATGVQAAAGTTWVWFIWLIAPVGAILAPDFTFHLNYGVSANIDDGMSIAVLIIDVIYVPVPSDCKVTVCYVYVLSRAGWSTVFNPTRSV